MVENDESINGPKNILFHWKYNNYEKDAKSSNPSTHQNVSISFGNMKIMKMMSFNQKGATARMLIITSVFEEKTMLTLESKKGPLQECI